MLTGARDELLRCATGRCPNQNPCFAVPFTRVFSILRNVTDMAQSNSIRRISWASSASLGRSSVRGGMVTAVGSWCRFGIQFATTVAIARILGPEEYGAAAVIVVFGAAAELLKDSGFSTLILQRRRLNRRLLSGVYYLNALAGVALALLLAGAGPWLSDVFHNPRYGLFALLLSTIFIFASVSAVPSALLARNFEFRRITVVDVIAVVLSSAAGLSAALVDWGALSLVIQAVVYMMMQAVLTTLSCPWRPGRPATYRVLRSTFPYVFSVSFSQALNYFSRNVDNVLIGMVFGPKAAGLYNQAYQLMVIPLHQVNGPLQRVFIPILSRISTDPDRYRVAFRKIVFTVTLILWPAFITLIVFSQSIITNLFGEQWRESAAIFSALGVAGMAQALGYVNSWVFVSSGQVRMQTIWTIVTRPLIVGSFFIGIPWGPHGMAFSYAVASVVVVLPGFFVARRRAGLRVGDLFTPLVWPSLLGGLTLLLAISLRAAYPFDSGLAVLLVQLSVLALVLTAAVWLIRPLRTHIAPWFAHLKGGS